MTAVTRIRNAGIGDNCVLMTLPDLTAWHASEHQMKHTTLRKFLRSRVSLATFPGLPFLFCLLLTTAGLAQSGSGDSLSLQIRKISWNRDTVRRPSASYTADFPFPILTFFSVVDAGGRPVRGLARSSDWAGPDELTDDGRKIADLWDLREISGANGSQPEGVDLFSQVPQARITELSGEDTAVMSIMLVMDVSGSIDSLLLARIKAATREFLFNMRLGQRHTDATREQDRVGIVIFPGASRSSVEEFQHPDNGDFITSDSTALSAFVGSLTTRPFTPLYRAVLRGLELLEDEPPGRPRALIVYTDGNDTERGGLTDNTAINGVNVKQAVTTADVPIFAIRLGTDADSTSLRTLATWSNGVFYDASEATRLGEINDRILDVFQHGYVMAHSTADLCGDTTIVRTLQISIKTATGVGVDTVSYRYRGNPREYDLHLSVTDAPERLSPGDTVRISRLLFNHGPDTAFDITLRDTLPALLNLQVDTTAVSLEVLDSLQILTWRLDSLAANSSLSLPISFNIDPGTALPDSVQLTSHLIATCDRSHDDNVVTLRIVSEPLPVPDISVFKEVIIDSTYETSSDGEAVVFAGASFAYRIIVTNEDTVAAHEVLIRDVLPPYLSSGTAVAGDTLQWQLGTLSSGEADTVSLVVKVDSSLPADTTLIENIAMASAKNEDPSTEHDNESRASVLAVRRVIGIELNLSYTVMPPQVVQGDTVRYTLAVSNSGQLPSDRFEVHDVFPDFTLAQPFSDFSHAPDLNDSGQLRWTVENLPPDSTRVISFLAAIETCRPLPESPFPFESAAFLTTPAQELLSDSLGVVVIVEQDDCPPPPFTIKSSADPDTVVVDEEFICSTEITNVGNETAYDLVVRGYVPRDTLEIVHIDPQPYEPVTSDTLTWFIDSLSPGSTFGFQVTVKVPDESVLPQCPAGLTFSGWLAGVGDISQRDVLLIDHADIVVECVPCPESYDLLVSKSVGSETVVPGKAFSYKLKVENLGPDFAHSILLKDYFKDYTGPPLDLDRFSVPTSHTYADTLFWEFDLAAGDSFVVHYDAHLPGGVTTSGSVVIDNQALVVAECESSPVDNSAEARVVVQEDGCEAFLLDRNVFVPSESAGDLKIFLPASIDNDYMTLDIFDVTGYRIARLLDSSNGPSAAHAAELSWDGMTLTGQQAGSGVYLVILRIYRDNRLFEECKQRVIVAQ